MPQAQGQNGGESRVKCLRGCSRREKPTGGGRGKNENETTQALAGTVLREASTGWLADMSKLDTRASDPGIGGRKS